MIFLSYTIECNRAFYLQSLKSHKDSIWYSRQPYGVNSLSKSVADMYTKAGIGEYLI